ncbi:response regulator [Lutispora thermophila]|uniref:Stage 0 sporulation protein A homolog n=1 Tax=Lutispora thermophila DSM 19022 TaxID=1122184 RepID=A0A1M6GKM4_9FIRM|nr:response regulator [Lutispora thermophila]SHJ10492.1 two-component system, response regulator YcbB [Lutispora thermophila DSM 19022]
MHRFIVIDDDRSIRSILIKVIEQYDLGEVIGEADNGEEGEKMIISYRPDIVIIDLLLPMKDGISIVKKIKELEIATVFIMLSQVTSKDIIGKAYENGVEFFINKPINIIEVVNIIKRVKEYITLRRTFQTIESAAMQLKKDENYGDYYSKDRYRKLLNQILSDIGIIGELGSKDIIKICYVLIKDNKLNNDLEEMQLSDIFRIVNERIDNESKNSNLDTKTIEMRIRRAVAKAMKNVATIGIEDFANEKFVLYSSSLFDYIEIKNEMDYIRGKSKTGGKVNVKTFIRRLLTMLEEYDNPF